MLPISSKSYNQFFHVLNFATELIVIFQCPLQKLHRVDIRHVYVASRQACLPPPTFYSLTLSVMCGVLFLNSSFNYKELFIFKLHLFQMRDC